MSNKAELVSIPVEDEIDVRIKKLEAEATRYRYSPVFQETIALLRKSHKPSAPQKHVKLTMTVDEAEKLYGLLGQITRTSGLNPVFESMDGAVFPLRRQRPTRLHFVRDNVVNVEY